MAHASGLDAHAHLLTAKAVIVGYAGRGFHGVTLHAIHHRAPVHKAVECASAIRAEERLSDRHELLSAPESKRREEKLR